MSPVLGRSKKRVRATTYRSYMHYLGQGKTWVICGWPMAQVPWTGKEKLVTCPWCKDELEKK